MTRHTEIAVYTITLMIFLTVAGYKIGKYEGNMEGATMATAVQLQEVKRMCDSRFLESGNLLLGNEIYTCKTTGDRLDGNQ